MDCSKWNTKNIFHHKLYWKLSKNTTGDFKTYIQFYTEITSICHPELVSGSHKYKMLKRVQHDGLKLFLCKNCI